MDSNGRGENMLATSREDQIKIATKAIEGNFKEWENGGFSPDSDDHVTVVAEALGIPHTHRDRPELAEKVYEAECTGQYGPREMAELIVSELT